MKFEKDKEIIDGEEYYVYKSRYGKQYYKYIDNVKFFDKFISDDGKIQYHYLINYKGRAYVFHRVYGPAVIEFGIEHYYLFGEKIENKKTFQKLVKLIAFS